jgi:hypothetical protein
LPKSLYSCARIDCARKAAASARKICFIIIMVLAPP